MHEIWKLYVCEVAMLTTAMLLMMEEASYRPTVFRIENKERIWKYTLRGD